MAGRAAGTHSPTCGARACARDLFPAGDARSWPSFSSRLAFRPKPIAPMIPRPNPAGVADGRHAVASGFRTIGRRWRWWLGELGALVPERLRAAFAADDAVLIEAREAELVVARRAGHREYTVARIPRDDFVARTLRLSVPQPSVLPADPVILQLPAAEALERSLTLPDGARRNLDAILRHESSATVRSTRRPSTTTIASRPSTVPPARSTVALRIVRREAVDALVQLASDAGITLAAIEFAGDEAHADGGTFPVDTAAARRMRLRPRLVPALATLLLVLALGLVRRRLSARRVHRRRSLPTVSTPRGRAPWSSSGCKDSSTPANPPGCLPRTAEAQSPPPSPCSRPLRACFPTMPGCTNSSFSGDEVRLHGFSASRRFAHRQIRLPRPISAMRRCAAP